MDGWKREICDLKTSGDMPVFFPTFVVVAFSSPLVTPPTATPNWHAAKLEAHGRLIDLVRDDVLIGGPRALDGSGVHTEPLVRALPRLYGFDARACGDLTPDLVAYDPKDRVIFVVEVTIVPDAALGRYVYRKLRKYRRLCSGAKPEAPLVCAAPLVIAVGTGGTVPESTQEALATLLSPSSGASWTPMLDGVLARAREIARSRPDAPSMRPRAMDPGPCHALRPSRRQRWRKRQLES